VTPGELRPFPHDASCSFVGTSHFSRHILSVEPGMAGKHAPLSNHGRMMSEIFTVCENEDEQVAGG
jgi:hypothetical protein